MAEESKQQDSQNQGKGSWWSNRYNLIRNYFVRKFPIVEKFWFGRKVVKGFPHPLEYELMSTWLHKNEHMFGTTLFGIEKGWAKEEYMLGGDKDKPKEGYLANPKGITSIYKELGVYSDLERINDEVKWFREGTGFIDGEAETEFPVKAIWEKLDWDPSKVEGILRNRNALKAIKEFKTKTLELRPGTVIHEGKVLEDIYCFGIENAKKVGDFLTQFGNLTLQEEYLRQKGITTQLRTQMTNSIRSITKLMEEISKIESENYTMLGGFSATLKDITGLWGKLLSENSPENTGVALIRFPHTYKIVKQYALIDIVEEIEIPGRKPYTIPKKIVSRLDPIMHTQANNIYTIEAAEINAKLQEFRNKMNVELAPILSSLRELRRVVATPKRFQTIISALAKRHRINIKAIISSADTDDSKYLQILNILNTNVASVNEIIQELLSDLKVLVIDILKSSKTEDEKTQDLEDLILNSLRLSSVVNAMLQSRFPKIKIALNPKDSQGKDRPTDDIVGSLKEAMSSEDEDVDIIIRTIFNEYNKSINGLVKNKGRSIDFKINVLIEFVDKYIKRNKLDKENGLAIIRLQRLLNKQADITLSYDQKMQRLQKRSEEINHITNKNQILNEIKPRISANAGGFAKRPEEYKFGLDEYGRPLEIDPQQDGLVLIDKWWKEIGENTWQLKEIALKPGGREVLRTHLSLNVRFGIGRNNIEPQIQGTPNRQIRHVADKRFYGQVDLLDLATMTYSYWDAVRDDFRDGRYHSYSKSVGDYVVEAMGGFHKTLGAPYFKDWVPGLKSKGFYIPRKGTIPTKPITLHVHNMEHQLVHATPDIFNSNIPDDEMSITKDFAMRMPITFSETGVKDGRWESMQTNILAGSRKPSKYNPAFDRRAQNIEQMIHWGRMYYWEWSGSINRWSENPFPHVSTRGIALYIAHLASVDMYYFDEAEKVMHGKKFDYGTRGQGMYPDINPVSGENIVGKDTEN